ncbi:MAG: hypothetical protein ACLFMM_09005 [Methanohalobium sp.]|uniref:hypothetical protein n=1 Tax=Methanohalobium sp. TaxID=2837493 RepID=UPI003978A4EF
MVELERVKRSSTSEREKIREMIKSRKENGKIEKNFLKIVHRLQIVRNVVIKTLNRIMSVQN